MKLFISLYVDEDVSILVSDLMRARGFDVITTRDAHLLGSDDAEQLAFAVAEQRTFLTHNRVDFEALATDYFQTGTIHYGIIIARRHPPYELSRRILVLLNQVTADEMVDQLRYI